MNLTAVTGGWINDKPLWRLTGAVVDGFPWHTVKCADSLSAWIRQQPADDWYAHPTHNLFDVHEKLYIVLLLKVNR